MKILPYNQKKLSEFSCYDSMLITISNCMKIDLTPYFLASFGFRYNSKINEDHTNMSIWYTIETENNFLADLCGIYLHVSNKENFIENAEDSIENRITPVGIEVDLLYLPWNELYKKRHQIHYITLVGYDDNNFICLDPYFTEDIQYINKIYLKEVATNLILLFFNKEKVIIKDKKDKIVFVKKYLKGNKIKHLDQLSNFAEDSFFLKNLLKVDEIEISQTWPVIILSNMVWSRNNFKNSLVDLNSEIENSSIQQIIRKVTESKNLWEMLKSYIIKSYYVGYKEDFVMKIKNIIRRIKVVEEEVFNLFEALEN